MAQAPAWQRNRSNAPSLPAHFSHWGVDTESEVDTDRVVDTDKGVDTDRVWTLTEGWILTGGGH